MRDGIGRITFNRPQARNALTFAMYERLAEICREVGAKGSGVRALLLTGAGEKAFAAGTDISQFRAFKTPEDALGYESRIDRVLGALEACPIPTIAAISGACTGGGAGIACVLRPAHRGVECALRLPGRAHARQLPVDVELRAAGVADRPGEGEGDHLHRAADRGAGSEIHRPGQRGPRRPRGADGARRGTGASSSPATRR